MVITIIKVMIIIIMVMIMIIISIIIVIMIIIIITYIGNTVSKWYIFFDIYCYTALRKLGKIIILISDVDVYNCTVEFGMDKIPIFGYDFQDKVRSRFTI